MAAPSMTYNAEANVLASQSLAASGSVTADVDATSKFGIKLQFKDTGGSSVATTNGLQVSVFEKMGQSGSEVIDTVAKAQFTITTVASTSSFQSVELPTGKYRLALKNLDTTNAITVEITSASIDGVS